MRRCRDFATARGWTVIDELVRCDEAKSAATMAGRDALSSLIAESKRRPAPFDCLLVDDTSRLARYLPDVLSMNDKLRYNGAFIYAVAQRLDCREKTSRPLLTLHGMMDEQFLDGLAEKVHRGQEGRALKGLQPGGRCFGYKNVPIEDPTRSGKYGMKAVVGVKLEILEEQADVVRRVFRMYADGESLASIAKQLNAEGVEAPQTPKKRVVRGWFPSAIREMLRNERYRGVSVWNRTKKERNPETGRKTSRQRPEQDWIRTEVPEWRIVADDLWNAAHQRIKFKSERFGNSRIGGFSRTDQTKRYLFSGLLACGVCGANLIIVSGGGLRGYLKYGCPSHRYRGVCSNKLTIRKDRLEEQLLSALAERVLQPNMVEYAIAAFQRELEKRLREIQEEKEREAGSVTNLQNRRRELKTRADNIAAAVASAGPLESLLGQLSSLEREIVQIDERLNEMNNPLDFAATIDEVRRFVTAKMADLKNVLRADAITAREVLSRHIQRLVLTPKETPEGPAFGVSGDVDLFGYEKDVVLMVAREGVEPPTRGFSVRCSTN